MGKNKNKNKNSLSLSSNQTTVISQTNLNNINPNEILNNASVTVQITETSTKTIQEYIIENKCLKTQLNDITSQLLKTKEELLKTKDEVINEIINERNITISSL